MIKKYKKWITDLNDEQYDILREFLEYKSMSKKDLSEMDKIRADAVFVAKTVNKNVDSAIDVLYNTESAKINHIISSKNIREKFNGLNTMFYGPTGTGKTSLVKKIIKDNNHVESMVLNMDEYISPKMGQTQLNLISLQKTINNKKGDLIIFIDEIDSFVLKRANHNDVGEHSRIVSSFIKFLDNLGNNVMVFACTNVISEIDEAILRRFNLKIEFKYFSLGKLIDIFNMENPGMRLSSRRKNELCDRVIVDEFKLSDLTFIEERVAWYQSMISDNIEVYEVMLVDWLEKFDTSDISDRTKLKMRRIVNAK